MILEKEREGEGEGEGERERERGRERERERERSVASGTCPDWGSNLQPFGVQNDAPAH